MTKQERDALFTSIYYRGIYHYSTNPTPVGLFMVHPLNPDVILFEAEEQTIKRVSYKSVSIIK